MVIKNLTPTKKTTDTLFLLIQMEALVIAVFNTAVAMRKDVIAHQCIQVFDGACRAVKFTENVATIKNNSSGSVIVNMHNAGNNIGRFE
ncbi:hypothetical protein [Enterobacter asburiae]|uniref:hypothetical protein n=1 Tax=Enterobacter asburiae TaxID=61645 RepID=UPI00192A79C3|nr:hypothetical protein [Enterobacter asburiae]MBL5924992.1 hypothetical protein [Enterobacter asburiae]MBL5956377.1 hypothetical protein [Enterobacter asburiae]